METIRHLLSVKYLFNQYPGAFTSVLAYYLLGGIILIMLVAVVLKMSAKKRDTFAQKSASKLFSLAWTMGWIGIILWIFRQINVFYLSAPIFWLIWLATGLFWGVFVFRYRFFIVPKRRAEIREAKSKKDYLPH